MLRVLRSVRRGLMSDDRDARLRAYALYAVGEIMLVVVGILIALQIGEWNEERNQEERVAQVLFDVRSELEADVAELGSLLDLGAGQDASAERVINGEVDREDYRNCMRLCYLGLNDREFTSRRTAWSRLSELSGTFPDRYEAVRTLLDSHYEGAAARLDEASERSATEARRRMRILVEEQPWGWRLLHEQTGRPDEMVDWFFGSERYRGWLALYRLETPYGESPVGATARLSAIAGWVAVSNALGESIDHPMVPEGLVLEDEEAVAEWLGDFDGPWVARLELRGGMLHWVERGGIFVQPLVAIDDGRYRLYRDETLTLSRDDVGAAIVRVTGGGGSFEFRRTDR